MKGPEFQIGNPPPTFKEDRYVLWESGYPVEVALYETLVWLRENLKNLVPDTNICIQQHTYSRGFITERVAYDFWSSISRLLDPKDVGFEYRFDAAELLSAMQAQSPAPAVSVTDHTEDFIETVINLNNFSRSLSSQKRMGVKEFFRALFIEGKEIVDWWTTFVRDLDMTDDIQDFANNREENWSSIISKVISDEVNSGNNNEDSGTVGYVEKSALTWERLKPILMFAEEIESYLPYANSKFEKFSIQGLADVSKKMNFRAETVHVNFNDSGGKKALLFVSPRYFRGIGTGRDELVHAT